MVRNICKDEGLLAQKAPAATLGDLDTARDLLDTAYDKGLLPDRTDSGFQNQITRLQFADLAVNLIEKATGKSVAPAENTFQDTSDPAVLMAVAAGVTSG